VERWQSEEKGPALQRGTDWHALMATFYGLRMRGIAWKRAYKLAWREHCLVPGTIQQTPEQLLLEWMLTGYCTFHDDNEWEILGVEIQHEVPIAPGYRLKVRADLIVRLKGTGRLWLVDSKTSKDLWREEDYVLHVQFPLYVWALRQAGIPVWGTIHDGVRTQRNKSKPQGLEERFKRTLVHHTDAALRTIARDAVRDISNARRQLERIRAKEDDMPRHFDQDRCRWRCSFLSPCLAGARSGRPAHTREFLLDLGFSQDPTRH